MRFTVGLLFFLSITLVGCGGGGGGGIGMLEAVIRGFVRDANNNPVLGARVFTFVAGQFVQDTSKVDGSFILRFPLNAPTTVIVTAQKDNVSAGATVQARPGAETQVTIILQLAPGGGGGFDGPPPPPF